MSNVFVLSTPAQKQTDPAKAPGQTRNPVPYQGTINGRMSRHGDYVGSPSRAYKPVHGGYPG